MQFVMVMFRADGERRSFSLTRDLTVIGRREDCDLRIPLGDVSRKHCRVVRSGDVMSIEDLGSSNGTFVNGQRVQETVLAAGDTVQVGPVVFCVQIDGVPAEEEMAPIFSAPPEPYNEEMSAEMMDEAADENAVAAAPTLDEGVEAELDDFEPVEAGDEQPVAEVGAEAAELGEIEELTESGAGVFMEDEETAAQSELIAEPLEEAEPLGEVEALEEATPAEAEGEDEVALEDFEVLEGDEPAPSDETKSGESHIDAPRH